MMNEKALFDVRKALVQAFLLKHDYDGILLTRPDNFAMATGGKRNYIYTYSDVGACSLFITKDGRAFFVGNTIEEPRMMTEELGALGCDVRDYFWFDGKAADTVRKEFSGALASDDGALGENVNAKLSPLRALLTETELEKYRRLGALATEAMMAVLDNIRSGMLEADIASMIVTEGAKRRCGVPVALVAVDDRIARFRHPLPTIRPLVSGSLDERGVSGYVMVVGCFLREGLVVSMTRFKQVGDIPKSTMDAFAHICGVDALMQEASNPGSTMGDVFAVCQRAYTDLGFPVNEWRNHHQGGLTGYAGRTCKGAPGEPFVILDQAYPTRAREILGTDVQFGHAFAWNPSATGVKSEDTFILLPDGSKEIVTSTPKLPQIDLAAVLGKNCSLRKSGIAPAI